ncbi:hypothetical protein L195_g048699 [Trifolium pratense]|uniref:Uncharacterized protein n=1 Tax=Trifolium pratense TaxID=57577 RepID=A0A2K3JM14_TRIPR|nr:hypothetical protein L195_g048699 [Trifolium pratense]
MDSPPHDSFTQSCRTTMKSIEQIRFIRKRIRFPSPPPVSQQRHSYHHPMHVMNEVPPNPLPSFQYLDHIVDSNDEVEIMIDLYRENHLTIEGMSYEELLALGERIDSVNTTLVLVFTLPILSPNARSSS